MLAGGYALNNIESPGGYLGVLRDYKGARVLDVQRMSDLVPSAQVSSGNSNTTRIITLVQ